VRELRSGWETLPELCADRVGGHGLNAIERETIGVGRGRSQRAVRAPRIRGVGRGVGHWRRDAVGDVQSPETGNRELVGVDEERRDDGEARTVERALIGSDRDRIQIAEEQRPSRDASLSIEGGRVGSRSGRTRDRLSEPPLPHHAVRWRALDRSDDGNVSAGLAPGIAWDHDGLGHDAGRGEMEWSPHLGGRADRGLALGIDLIVPENADAELGGDALIDDSERDRVSP
jgi:hypothetical protein